MSPTIVNSDEIPINDELDLQKWLKEIENAEDLMSEVEAKADNLQAKVDALLLEVNQNKQNNEQQQQQQQPQK